MSRLTKSPILMGLIGIAILATFGAIRSHFSEGNTPEDIRLLRKLQSEYINHMHKTTSLRCSGLGAGGIDDIEKLTFFFRSPDRLEQTEMDKARGIALNCSETLLTMLNTNEAIRPYLVQHPMTSKNISIFLTFSEGEGDVKEPKPLDGMTISRGEVEFQICGKGKYELVKVRKEPYEEALRKISSPPDLVTPAH